ncbi:hypothetical protein RKLH11_1418 [Rhodobacteraceae bacterium KLH11]|nr:hypothetical protein RKLH11_1418 [Rhodobacteraceae bacterium KLH11]
MRLMTTSDIDARKKLVRNMPKGIIPNLTVQPLLLVGEY